MSTGRITTGKCSLVAHASRTIGGERVERGITRISADHPWAQTGAFVEVDSEWGQEAIRDAGGGTERRVHGAGLFWFVDPAPA
jgi:hypothetical protein